MDSYCIECQHDLPGNNPATCSTESIVGRWQKGFHHYRLMLKRRRVDRQALKDLTKLDDAGLKDIGLTRNDILWASQLPLSLHASLELEKIAREPRQK